MPKIDVKENPVQFYLVNLPLIFSNSYVFVDINPKKLTLHFQVFAYA